MTLLLLLVDPAGEDHQQKLPGVEDEAHDAPMWEVGGNGSSIGWWPTAVNRPKRASVWALQVPCCLTLAVRLSILTIRDRRYLQDATNFTIDILSLHAAVTGDAGQCHFTVVFSEFCKTIEFLAMSSRKGARAGGEKGATWVQE